MWNNFPPTIIYLRMWFMYWILIARTLVLSKIKIKNTLLLPLMFWLVETKVQLLSWAVYLALTRTKYVARWNQSQPRIPSVAPNTSLKCIWSIFCKVVSIWHIHSCKQNLNYWTWTVLSYLEPRPLQGILAESSSLLGSSVSTEGILEMQTDRPGPPWTAANAGPPCFAMSLCLRFADSGLCCVRTCYWQRPHFEKRFGTFSFKFC